MNTSLRLKANTPWDGHWDQILDSGYNRLAQAIILQAVIDYIKLQNDLLTCPRDSLKYSTIVYKSKQIEKFFYSEYFLIFSEFRAASVIEICRKRAKEMTAAEISQLGKRALKSESAAKTRQAKRNKNAENIDETTGGINT